MIGDKPLTSAEKVKRHRQKLRGIVEPIPQSCEPSAEERLRQARREILELRRELDRLRADAGLTTAPSQDAGASATLMMDEDVEADYGPTTGIWAAMKRAERLLKAGKPL
ncbi:hypothetical protein [Mesorhizobium sp. M0843]|uniref:hypothetical protein n=1 Tax=Mesorhizobium sp. M0843 TaxID=2957010 RepID=UPI003338A58B